MNKFWKKLFGVEEKICKHDKNYRKLKFFGPDGTPMIDITCHDCGYKDEGHVYVNVEDWENHLVVCMNGKKIIDISGGKHMLDDEKN